MGASNKKLLVLLCLPALMLAGCELTVSIPEPTRPDPTPTSTPSLTPVPTSIPTPEPTEPPVSSSVIFSSDFEDVADWVAPRGDGSTGFPNTWNRAANPRWLPPKKMDGSWLHPNSWFRAAPSQLAQPAASVPMATIGAGQGRAGSRGMTYNVEVAPDVGPGWTGGSPLTMYLGDTGYHEMYVAMWIRYSSDFKWLPDVLPTPDAGMQKLVYISRLNEPLTSGFVDNHSNGPLHPTWVPHLTSYISSAPFYQFFMNRSQQSNGALVAYDQTRDMFSANPSLYPQNAPLKWPVDGQWHHWEYHIRMNSAPGVADGVQEIWIDGVKQFSKRNMAFVLSGGSVTRGFNYVELFDNARLISHPSTANVTYPISIDDVVISTDYVGPQ